MAAGGPGAASAAVAAPAAVAWVPLAPVVVPEIGGPDARDGDLARLRAAVAAAVTEAVAALTRRGGGTVVVVAPTEDPVDARPPARWSWHGFGVGSAPDPSDPVLPWPLGIGARLLDDAGWRGARRYVGVPAAGPRTDPPDTPPRPAVSAPVRETALLVLGDGSACRGEQAPGGDDPRAGDWDVQLAVLLRRGDRAGLARLDPVLGAELLASAAVSFPAAAALLEATGTPAPAGTEMRYDAAPYGVGYLVATWTW